MGGASAQRLRSRVRDGLLGPRRLEGRFWRAAHAAGHGEARVRSDMQVRAEIFFGFSGFMDSWPLWRLQTSSTCMAYLLFGFSPCTCCLAPSTRAATAFHL